MAIPEDYKGKYFYHFTHIENLDSILKHGFLCTNLKDKLKLLHTNVASENIQNRRSEMKVTCGPQGVVHDYVPFYLATTNPMALAVVNGKNVDQIDLVFVAISIEKVLEDNVIFTDASANTIVSPNFFTKPEDLKKLNWEAIDSRKWGNINDNWKHERMAEVLISDRVPIEWIDYIIVWNKHRKKIVLDTFNDNGIAAPRVEYSLNGRHFYFTKFALGRPGETLVTGPNHMQNLFLGISEKIIESRKQVEKFTFDNIKDALSEISKNFCAIEELEGIFELETINDVHKENVSDHTLNVVSNLEKIKHYKRLDANEKELVKLSAYLHDIGKGPSRKWKNGKQPAYADHPADSLKMLVRFLSEDIKNLSDKNIKLICLLVAYHDLLGDIVGKGRSIKELLNIIESKKELKMLIALSLADIGAINSDWLESLQLELPAIVKKVKANLK
ncbi:DUF4433 domain-containing protein [Arenibacter sp. ARW7G5Y1]|uniref:type II toxin-antitoxin system toxin DNA ADP-ribosyl transferase DarT n=1 Tax=Arenibacter sp. ARW7G5Y1 TaxID=2135619 RepID=UPI000D7604D8|nr:DUF4433 domain-containing protein [Arenibacter sp. ARW7G5Y1]PXX27319.1 HD domain-containing protein [Arenibacter sp. ARW7G5Y1]